MVADLTLPVHPDNIYNELDSVEKLVAKWREAVGNGLPGIDKPAQDAEARLESFLMQMTGEMMLAAGKLQNLSMVLAGQTVSM